MNLWAKSLRQLSFVAVALFFFSCEDENSVLGLKNPNPKFNVAYVDIPLTSNVQLIDSIITDNKGAGGNLLLGKYQDNIFGSLTAVPYLQIYPAAATQIPGDAIFDSVTFSIRYNFYGYGFSGERTEHFEIFELLDSIDRSSKTRYEFDSTLPYNPGAIGQSSVTVKSDSLKKQLGITSTKQDTLTARARLNDALGIKIFKLLQQYNFTSTTGASANAQVRDFLGIVKGIALVPTDSKAILGFRIFNALSAVTLHYRTKTSGVVSDTVTRSLAFNTASFTNIQADRSASIFSGAVPYQSLSGSSTTGKRYIQSGNAIVTKLDLGGFYQFADTVGNVLVNEASLVIDGVESPLMTPAINALSLKVMNENNQFTNYALAATDRIAMTPYALSSLNPAGAVLVDGKHFLIKSDVPGNAATVAYLQLSDGKYSGYLTLFLQQLLKHSQNNSSRLRYLALYPQDPTISSSVNRTVFDAANVKLRIFYTKPTLTTTP